MKFCSACGKSVVETAVICPSCGSPISGREVSTSNVVPWSVGAMIGYGLLAFVLPLVGIIMGIIAVTKEPRRIQGVVLLIIAILALPFWSAVMS